MNERTKQQLWRILLLGLSVLVLVYFVYQFYQAAHESVRTEVVRQSTVKDTVDTKLFVVRDESFLETGSDGILVPLVPSGSRVAAGESVVAIFNSEEDASRYAERNRVEENLARYTRLNQQKGTSAVNLNALGKRISQDVIDLAELVDNGDLTDMQEQVYDVRDRILARQVATGETVPLENKVTELTSRQKALSNTAEGYETLDSERSGFFIGSVDGYELATKYDKVSKLTPEDIEKLLKSDPDEVSDKVIGKVSTNFDWYLLCTLDADTAKTLKKGETVTIDLPYSAVRSVTATVASKSKADKKDNVAVVFKCNRMNAYIASLRKEEGQIILHTYTGLKIPTDAIRTTADGKEGVYVQEGNIVKFKQLRTVYTEDDYIISSETPKEGETGDFVSLYDAVILGGKDLYDGKILN
ncbi:MAG: hypothetical protein II572_01985 [Clostridia bacterium]|nr:hypothetical protein [Clostridia bacterium]MBQ3995997.1 hypothetical protein [Clostridia bacterium]MBQ6785714.1 hypothetical protein [Clostridia bacterium]